MIATLVAAQTVSAQSKNGRFEYFEKHIRPALVRHCYECHSVDANKREGGLLLDSKAALAKGGSSGPAVVPGKPEQSLLLKAIRYEDDNLQMPPEDQLPKEVVQHFERWIRAGAPDPRTALKRKTGRVEPSDPVAGRTHWAFKPLQTPEIPVVVDSEWPESSIDFFVLSSLEANGLKPVAQADRRTIVRRLYFVLIGLPPTPQQTEAFLSDNRPDAYERLVDELLAAPQFGERWGRHWLDLARYADSNGLDENFLFREAWRYRNWVISAMNKDLSYDRFLIEQLAGDLLPFNSITQRDEQRIAAGFLVVGPKVLLGVNKDKQKMEVADEQLDTIGRTVLGQTIGCARCHDHKFDPIPTADYYALAGIMTSTSVMQRRYMLGSQRVMERLVGLGADGEQLNKQYEKFHRERPALNKRVAQAKDALKAIKEKNLKRIKEIAKTDREAVAGVALDSKATHEAKTKAQQNVIDALTKVLSRPPAIPPRAMIPEDVQKPADESIRLGGQFDRPGKSVRRGFLQVIGGEADIRQGRSGRLELAKWLTDKNAGAAHVSARVMANRVWYHLIGRGVVRTLDNFGRTGERPVQPQLLDYLATQLIDNDWSVKYLVREIVLSRTFRLGSEDSSAARAKDPENQFLWRAHRRRLDPESFRDAMLAAGGILDLKPMQSSVWYLGDQATAVGANKNRRRTDFPCRSVYLPIIRNDLPDVLEAFDFANPHTTTGMRDQTTVATQGLFVLNHQDVLKASDAIAERLLRDAAITDELRVATMFDLILNANASDREISQVIAFIRTIRKQVADAEQDSQKKAWSLACQALIASSRFQILE